MASFPSKGKSFWVESAQAVNYPALEDDLKVDVAIIGGGITGLTAAYLLKQRGKRVAVFEKKRIASGISGFTTGKVTSQHGLIYNSLVNDFGETTARLYGEANQAAIQQIEDIITTEKIDCDWHRENNYVYTDDPSNVEKFKSEAATAASLGLPAEYVGETSLPYDVATAVKFSDQATMHIGDYLQGLARLVDGDGSFVLENSKASLIRGGSPARCRVNGHTVRAKDIIIATNVPTPAISHALYSLYVYPMRSYIVAGRVKQPVQGMFITSEQKPSRSILPAKRGSEDWLLVGGEGHIVGKSGPAFLKYRRLKKFARRYFKAKKLKYQWSTWDYVAYDSLPMVGKLWPLSRHVYTATGFRKWGLTNGTVAAMILTDQITGRKNPWARAFRTNRLSAVTSLPKGIVRGFFS